MEEVDREAVDIVLGDLVLELRHSDQILGKEGWGPGHQQRARDINAEGEQSEQAHVLPTQQHREEVSDHWAEEEDGGAEAGRGPGHRQVQGEQEEAVKEAGHQEPPPSAGGTKGVRSGDQQQGQREQQLEETPVQSHRPGGQRRGQAGDIGAAWEIIGEP